MKDGFLFISFIKKNFIIKYNRLYFCSINVCDLIKVKFLSNIFHGMESYFLKIITNYEYQSKIAD